LTLLQSTLAIDISYLNIGYVTLWAQLENKHEESLKACEQRLETTGERRKLDREHLHGTDYVTLQRDLSNPR